MRVPGLAGSRDAGYEGALGNGFIDVPPDTKLHEEAKEVLAFWFGAPDAPDHGQARAAWFKKDPAFDDGIRASFGALHDRAVAGELEAWAEDTRGCLALIILLDQFSRNLYRDDPRAFATDNRARALARHAIERGYDRAVLSEMRTFFYLPFEHSEALEDQNLSIRLFKGNDGVADHASKRDYARRHYDVIARFGRFPHRNALLRRASTPEELEFLKHTPSGF